MPSCKWLSVNNLCSFLAWGLGLRLITVTLNFLLLALTSLHYMCRLLILQLAYIRHFFSHLHNSLNTIHQSHLSDPWQVADRRKKQEPPATSALLYVCRVVFLISSSTNPTGNWRQMSWDFLQVFCDIVSVRMGQMWGQTLDWPGRSSTKIETNPSGRLCQFWRNHIDENETDRQTSWRHDTCCHGTGA